MARRPRERSIRFNMRLSPYQAEKFIEIQKRLGAATASDAFDYLVTLGSHKDCGFEELIFAMGDQISETIERRFRHIAFMLELNLAMTDTHVKYSASVLPHLSEELVPAARQKGIEAYRKMMLCTAREFQKRKRSGAYRGMLAEFEYLFDEIHESTNAADRGRDPDLKEG